MIKHPQYSQNLAQHDPALASTLQPPGSRSDPGETLGIISIVLDVIGLGLVGIVFGVLSKKKSRAAGFDGMTGKIGLVLGIVFTVLTTLVVVGFFISLLHLFDKSTLSPPAIPTNQI